LAIQPDWEGYVIGDLSRLKKKVWVKCGKKVDEITPFMDKIKETYKKEEEKKKLAKYMFYDECKNKKSKGVVSGT
jgi:hypothetical protein